MCVFLSLSPSLILSCLFYGLVAVKSHRFVWQAFTLHLVHRHLSLHPPPHSLISLSCSHYLCPVVPGSFWLWLQAWLASNLIRWNFHTIGFSFCWHCRCRCYLFYTDRNLCPFPCQPRLVRCAKSFARCVCFILYWSNCKFPIGTHTHTHTHVSVCNALISVFYANFHLLSVFYFWSEFCQATQATELFYLQMHTHIRRHTQFPCFSLSRSLFALFRVSTTFKSFFSSCYVIANRQHLMACSSSSSSSFSCSFSRCSCPCVHPHIIINT